MKDNSNQPRAEKSHAKTLSAYVDARFKPHGKRSNSSNTGVGGGIIYEDSSGSRHGYALNFSRFSIQSSTDSELLTASMAALFLLKQDVSLNVYTDNMSGIKRLADFSECIADLKGLTSTFKEQCRTFFVEQSPMTPSFNYLPKIDIRMQLPHELASVGAQSQFEIQSVSIDENGKIEEGKSLPWSALGL